MLTRRAMMQSMAAAISQPSRPPNLVFMLSDDLGYADLGCYESKDIRTPHIDSLARDGVRFTGCYANAPVCTPTRVAFLTGRYQQRYGRDLEGALGPANNKTAGLRPEDSILPQALKQGGGYRCGVFGKWHVGWCEEFRPLRHGFDEFFGILLGNVDMYTHKYHDDSDDLWDGNRPVRQRGYLTDLLAERAVRFIERNADNPFFLYLPFNAPHWPFQAPAQEHARSAEMWRDGTRAEYRGMVESMDSAVGAVLGALKRRGLDGNTLVIFTNDNGGERLSDSGPLFHTKGTLWEGGIRVPAVARWPGQIAAGSLCRTPAVTMDFTQTLIQAGRSAQAANRRGASAFPDGLDLMPLLRGEAPEPSRMLCWRINRAGRNQLAARRGKWKYLDDNTGNRGLPEMLFDLETDPGERHNLFRDNQELTAELRREALAWQEQMDRESNLRAARGVP